MWEGGCSRISRSTLFIRVLAWNRAGFAGALEFFIYDTIKIFLLLSVIIFIVSIIRSYFPPERTKRILSHKREFIGNILAALLGIVTPFCSCSAVPLFIGFVEAGVPLGVTFSFLISSPMVNEVAVVLLWGLFGWKIALIYLGTGLLVAIIAGMIIGKLKLEKWVEEYVYQDQVPGCCCRHCKANFQGSACVRPGKYDGYPEKGLGLCSSSPLVSAVSSMAMCPMIFW